MRAESALAAPGSTWAPVSSREERKMKHVTCLLFSLLLGACDTVTHTPLAAFDGGDAGMPPPSPPSDGGLDLGMDTGIDLGSDAGFDGGMDLGAFVCTFDKNGLMVPMHERQATGDGCNDCRCEPDSNAPSGYSVRCTAAGCIDAGVPNSGRCDTSADCLSGQSFCHFDAICGERGWCGAPQSGCAAATNPVASPDTTEPVFCGCDGVTYVGRNCYTLPWRHLGPCTP